MRTDHQSILASPINRSVSKQLYSFPKSIRFGETRQSLCQGSYDIKTGAFGSRATGFGYGNKMNLVENAGNPPVGNYEQKSEFMRNIQKRKGFGFSKQRRDNTLVNPEKSVLLPGPGAYSHGRTLKTNPYKSISFSMGGRLDDPTERHQNLLGPGQYETIPSLTSTGQYFYSKYSSSGCGKIGRSKRSDLANNSRVPGPGQYSSQEKDNLNTSGTYFNSKFRNMEAGRFPRSNRPGLADSKGFPGPGQYGNFTEFADLNKSSVKRASTSGRN